MTIPFGGDEFSLVGAHSAVPLIMVKGQRLHALAHFAAPLPAKALRRPVDNVPAQSSSLVTAIDAVLPGI
jgi:toxin CcdB